MKVPRYITHSNRIFHYPRSILGIPHLLEPAIRELSRMRPGTISAGAPMREAVRSDLAGVDGP